MPWLTVDRIGILNRWATMYVLDFFMTHIGTRNTDSGALRKDVWLPIMKRGTGCPPAAIDLASAASIFSRIFSHSTATLSGWLRRNQGDTMKAKLQQAFVTYRHSFSRSFLSKPNFRVWIVLIKMAAQISESAKLPVKQTIPIVPNIAPLGEREPSERP